MLFCRRRFDEAKPNAVSRIRIFVARHEFCVRDSMNARSMKVVQRQFIAKSPTKYAHPERHQKHGDPS
jgi:hypothetical protein